MVSHRNDEWGIQIKEKTDFDSIMNQIRQAEDDHMWSKYSAFYLINKIKSMYDVS